MSYCTWWGMVVAVVKVFCESWKRNVSSVPLASRYIRIDELCYILLQSLYDSTSLAANTSKYKTNRRTYKLYNITATYTQIQYITPHIQKIANTKMQYTHPCKKIFSHTKDTIYTPGLLTTHIKKL